MNSGRIQFVGVGGGGVRMLSHLHDRWRDVPDLAVVHTNEASLAAATVAHRVRIGEGTTEGLSTGGDVEIGRRAAEESAAELRELWRDVAWGCVVTSLGGGTGGGAAPVVCRLAREAGAWTLAVCTLPFFFEGAGRRRRAEESLRQLRAAADAVIVLPNQRLFEWTGEQAPIPQAFEAVDEVVAVSLRSLWRLLTQRWLIAVDLADLRKMARGPSDTLALAAFEATGEQRATTLLNALRESPLLERGSVIASARALLLAVVGGPDLKLSELDRLFHGTGDFARSDVELSIGAAVDPEYEGRIALTVLATDRLPEIAAAEAPAAPATAKAEGGGGTAPAAPAGTAAASGRPVQGTLPLEPPGKGRFKDLAPTYFEGEDIDVPTFLRRGIRLERDH